MLSLLAPTQGILGILTLVVAGGIWFGHWLLERGDLCLHVGTANLFVAWCVTIYHFLGATSRQQRWTTWHSWR